MFCATDISVSFQELDPLQMWSLQSQGKAPSWQDMQAPAQHMICSNGVVPQRPLGWFDHNQQLLRVNFCQV
jgi:hypothetical protein